MFCKITVSIKKLKSVKRGENIMDKKTVNIIGAFDRYNYGDLLFPIVIEEYINEFKPQILKDYTLRYFGLVESDLSSVGGKKTEALANLYNDELAEGSMIIVSGGDVLPARISSMDVDLSRNNFTMISKKVVIKAIGRRNFEKVSMKKFKLNTRFPWIVEKRNFKNKVYVAYNAVGGSTLNKLPAEEVSIIKKQMSESDYISVRDNKSYSNVSDLNSKLSPDSAVIMSHFFTKEVLKEKVSDEVREFVTNKANKYICIQSNLCSIRNKADELVREIERISKDVDVEVLLLPIGIAANHDDNIALNRLKKHFNIKVKHIEKVNIYDIMYLIANCKFFAGTSLHGNITSMAYAVPHIGLNREISKLDNYLKTWDLEEQDHCIDFSNLYNEFKKIIKISKADLEAKRDELVKLAMNNFEEIFRCLEENSCE